MRKIRMHRGLMLMAQLGDRCYVQRCVCMSEETARHDLMLKHQGGQAGTALHLGIYRTQQELLDKNDTAT